MFGGIPLKSFVIWYEGEDKDICLDININLWRAEIKSNKKNDYFLDLGLMIEKVSELKKSIYYSHLRLKKKISLI